MQKLIDSQEIEKQLREELQESNEKLQTTVEELRTSNEELQLTNAELQASFDSNKELQNKLSLILESSMDGILGIDMHSRHTFVNERAAQLLGYSAEYLIGKSSHQIWHHTKSDGSSNEQNECPIMGTLEKGETLRGEDLFWRKDGSSFPVEFVRSPIRKDGKIMGAVINFHDITKEKALKSEFENVIRFAPNPIMLYDEDGKILMINKTFEELTGYTLKELPNVEIWSQKSLGGKNIMNTLDIEEFFKKNVRENMGIKKVTTKCGKELTWVCSLSPLGSVRNAKRILIASTMDITEIQKKEDMMLAQSRQAAMGDMIGMIAHQWRQPLSVISMVGNNLRVTLDLDGKVTSHEIYQFTDLLNEQVQYLSHTIDDFRTFFRPEKTKEKVVLCKVYEKLESMVRKLLENNQIILTFSGDCNIEFYIYQNELIQVLLNLLNNAKDVMKERNSKDANINIETTFTEDLLTISISDNGGGIEKSVMGKLGEPYVTTKNENGTGLGIYMSLMIVKKHFDGAMQWQNIDGGSCFTITLPLQKSDEGIA